MATPTLISCLDCGSPVSGAHCSVCGQRVESPVQPFGTFVRESLAELFALDGRVISGLRDVALKPGFLTSEFLAGRRTRHLHPVRLLLAAGLVAFVSSRLIPGDSSGLVLGATRAVLGDASNWVVIFVSLSALLTVTACQAMVYRRSGRLFIEHAVLILHAVTFAMLLTPVEVVALRIFEAQGMFGGASTFFMAPVVIVYWILSLRDVFRDNLPMTLLKASLTTVLASSLLLALIFVLYGVM